MGQQTAQRVKALTARPDNLKVPDHKPTVEEEKQLSQVAHLMYDPFPPIIKVKYTHKYTYMNARKFGQTLTSL